MREKTGEAILYKGISGYYITLGIEGSEYPQLPGGLEFVATSDFRPISQVETWVGKQISQISRDGNEVKVVPNNSYLCYLAVIELALDGGSK